MATKAVLLLLAYVLLVTNMVSSIEETVETEVHVPKYVAKPPAHAPAKSPTHAPPKKAPAPAPKKPLVHPPTKAPAHPPVKAKGKAPAPPVAPKHECIPMCREYCGAHHSKRNCMRDCTPCCAKLKCVPGPKKCSNWDHVKFGGETVKCP